MNPIQYADRPGEIQFPPPTPEIRPPQEPVAPGRPGTDPEVVPGKEPEVPQRPAEVPPPPEKQNNHID